MRARRARKLQAARDAELSPRARRRQPAPVHRDSRANDGVELYRLMRAAIEAGDRAGAVQALGACRRCRAASSSSSSFSRAISAAACAACRSPAGDQPRRSVPLVTWAELWEKAALSGRRSRNTTSTAGSSCSISSRPRPPLFASPELPNRAVSARVDDGRQDRNSTSRRRSSIRTASPHIGHAYNDARDRRASRASSGSTARTSSS